MGRVMIRCPEFGKLVFTGVEVDRDRWERSEEPFESHYPVRCPRCGELHQWGRQDAVYQEDF